MEKKLSNKKFRIFIFSILSLAIVVYPFMMSSHVKVNLNANSGISALQQQYQQLQSTINNINNQVQNNNSAIANLSGKIKSYQDLISAKQVLVNNEKAQVDQLNSQISSLNAQILSEQNQINVIKGKIDQNAKSGYEETYIPPVTIFMGNSNINSDIASVVYFKATIAHENSLVIQMDNLISSLNSNKASVQLKQQDAQSLLNQEVSTEDSLIADQSVLQQQENSYISSNNSLNSSLVSAQNQEEQILSQINLLTEAAYNTGSYAGCIPGNYWYYCQQWYGRLSGEYGTSINMQYGCLVASIAMVATKEVSSIYTPPMIASMTWFSSDYMESFPNIPGHSIQTEGYGISAVNAALSQGLPAITYLDAPAGQHWIVIYSQLSNGDYLINDPWYGSALTFLGTGGGTHEYYDSSEIGQVLVLQ